MLSRGEYRSISTTWKGREAEDAELTVTCFDFTVNVRLGTPFEANKRLRVLVLPLLRSPRQTVSHGRLSGVEARRSSATHFSALHKQLV